MADLDADIPVFRASAEGRIPQCNVRGGGNASLQQDHAYGYLRNSGIFDQFLFADAENNVLFSGNRGRYEPAFYR